MMRLHAFAKKISGSATSGRHKTLAIVVLLFATFATCVPAEADHGDAGFVVEFTNCVESIGVTLLPTVQIEAMIPDGFVVVGTGQPVTPIVVRTARCGISVDGRHVRTGSVVQIGAVIVPPDFTGDIDNYTLLYYTSDNKLAQELTNLGIPAQFVPTIDYDLISGQHDDPDQLHVTVPRSGQPLLSISGEVIPSHVPAGTFTANWWARTRRGTIRMQTFVPEISIGTADLQLTVPAGSSLSELIGGETIGFPILQQFNSFPDALMNVENVAAPNQ
jgi:hypothetical protein